MEEIWKDVLGYEGHYQVSNIGRVKSMDRVVPHARGPRELKGRIMKGYKHDDYPYYVVNLYKRRKLKHTPIHRLVAIAFVPNPNNLECVNHLDGDKLNNHYTNFEWCTRGENIKHAHLNGLMPNNKGSKRYNSKLIEKDIPIIRALYKHLGIRLCGLAAMYQIDRMAITKVIKNKSWIHV